MTFIGDLREVLGLLEQFRELDVDAAMLPESALRLGDTSVRDLLAAGATLARAIGTFNAVMAGVAAQRSSRDRGHGGFAAETGHRSPVALIQEITGSSKSEAIRAVKVGEALLEGAVSAGSREVDAAPRPVPWHQPLRDALLAGVLSTAQHNAILHGLGTPPVIDGRDPGEVTEAWRAAARELAAEAGVCTVEDLAGRARVLRDLLDPTGAEDRFAARFAKRSYRSSVDADGVRHGHITFDDEAGVWMQHLLDTALSPRRGGPRFVAEGEKAKADKLTEDPRSNEQLAYDLLLDLLRTGAAASAEDVYGTKEPGVRLVVIKDTLTGAARDAFGRLLATAATEDGAIAIPGSVLDRALCVTGTVEVTVDTCGNPLDVGREQRLFTRRQRLALAIRDGGCMWPGCDRPPSCCEAHHCAHWADGGRTDCDVGILLCRYHHLTLHNNGWRITRNGKGAFHLHPPPGTGDGAPIPLRSKSPLRWLWDPPPDRPRWRTAA